MKQFMTAETLSKIKPAGAVLFAAGYSHRAPSASSAHWMFVRREDAVAFLRSLIGSPYRIVLHRRLTEAGLRWIVSAPCAQTGHLVQIFWQR